MKLKKKAIKVRNNFESFQDLLNKNPDDFYHPDDADHMKESFKQVMLLKGQVRI